MGYRIVYLPLKNKHRRRSGRLALTAIAFAVFVWTVRIFWDEGYTVLLEFAGSVFG